MLHPLRLSALAALSAVLTFAVPLHAQFGKRLKDAVTRNAENRAIHEVVQQENKVIDAALTAALSPGDEAAGDTLYRELTEGGRLPMTGIVFEPGTATMTEESAPSLKAIGSMLQSHADVAVRLEAYTTDKQVAAARADAIKQALVKAYAIADARLETAGYLAKTGERVDLVQQ